MARPRLYADAAAKQRAYRARLKARRYEAQGPTDADLAREVRDLHIRLEYAAVVTPVGAASQLVGKDAQETLRKVVVRLSAIEQF
jgi:hypothetical protein